MEDKLFNAQELLEKITKQLTAVDSLLNYEDETIWFDPDSVTLQTAYENKPDEGFMVYACFDAFPDEAVIKEPLYDLLKDWMELFTYTDKRYDKEDTDKFLSSLDEIVADLKEHVKAVGFHKK
jgi:hypothetical protein